MQSVWSQISTIYRKYWFPALLFLVLLVTTGRSQSTGKLAGVVTSTDGDPLIGVNIELEGTNLGAATDTDGFYLILNVRAGVYTVRFSYVGYRTQVVEKFRVNADRTTNLNVRLKSAAIEGETVVVTASRPIVEFNQTSSVSTVGKEEIEVLPVQNLTEIVNLQAGVIDGHFRGGRIGEVQYQVDGVTVNNPYDNSSTLQLDRSVLEEVQVISGTFDAKYGQAMSGVVNAVLRSGSDRFDWRSEVYSGDFYTTDSKRYPHNNSFNPAAIRNYQLMLSGPLFIPNTTYFLSARRYLNDGYLFGERRFLPTDSSNFETREFRPTGDGKLVTMQTWREWSGQFKLSNQSLEKVQLSYQALLNDVRQTRYNHAFRLNPQGITKQKTFSVSHGLDITHTISRTLFYKLNLRQNYFDYSDYAYEDLFDPRYLEAGQPLGDPNYEHGSVVQGVDLSRFIQKSNNGIVKGAATWQVNRSNLVESGVEFQASEISFGSPGFIVPTTVGGVQILQPRQNLPRQPGVQTYYPRQFNAYLQNRVEWKDLVLRAGVRLEYFDANARVPDDLQNPANAIAGAPKSVLRKTIIKSALAPRLGFSFPLSAAASLYFSYGHFYQMPGLGLLYNNADYSVLDQLQEGGISYGVMGNPDLKPERTIQYEFGLKQALTSFLGLDLSFFYKDIRDLLGTEFVTTYAAAEYARFTNVDFGSVYGTTIAFDQRAIGPISTTLDYTLQFARGNSSDPRETAIRAASGKDPRPRDIPFNWDQRHTLNATAIFAVANNYTLSAIFRLGSGQPYTPQIGSGYGADLETNSGLKSSYALLDVRAEKYVAWGPLKGGLYLRVFNLLNTHFVNGFVFATTGSPDYSQFPATDRVQLLNPARFYEPRRIEIGFTVEKK